MFLIRDLHERVDDYDPTRPFIKEFWSGLRSLLSSTITVSADNPFTDASYAVFLVRISDFPDHVFSFQTSIRRAFAGDGVSNRVSGSYEDYTIQMQVITQTPVKIEIGDPNAVVSHNGEDLAVDAIAGNLSHILRSFSEISIVLGHIVNVNVDAISMVDVTFTPDMEAADAYFKAYADKRPTLDILEKLPSIIEDSGEGLDDGIYLTKPFSPEVGPMVRLKLDVNLRKLNIGELKWNRFLESILLQSGVSMPATPTSMFLLVSMFNSKTEGVELDGDDPFTYLDKHSGAYTGMRRATRLDIYLPTYNSNIGRVQLIHVILV